MKSPGSHVVRMTRFNSGSSVVFHNNMHFKYIIAKYFSACPAIPAHHGSYEPLGNNLLKN
jgi:hypothetical protein